MSQIFTTAKSFTALKGDEIKRLLITSKLSGYKFVVNKLARRLRSYQSVTSR